jgi:23S rRNA (adenine2030-N6)-methyltransferase
VGIFFYDIKIHMNYRHIYHAGNFADVIKHLALVLCLDYLKKKDAPLCVIDAHGGCGLYDLSSEQAGKTGEWVHGIGRFSDEKNFPDDLNLYLSIVRPYLSRKTYPGSPVIISDLLRRHDRLIANELHPEDVRTLKENVPGAQVTHLDAYECIRAHIPPARKTRAGADRSAVRRAG